MNKRPPIYLSQEDFDRLTLLLDAHAHEDGGRRFAQLEEELARARILPACEIPDDVVTMNSRVVFEDEKTRERREIVLVYPNEADIDAGKVSVLVPVGSALLGLRVGQSIDWTLPGGQKRRYRVVAVPYQPKAAESRD